jgi:hypothetical protein
MSRLLSRAVMTEFYPGAWKHDRCERPWHLPLLDSADAVTELLQDLIMRSQVRKRVPSKFI